MQAFRACWRLAWPLILSNLSVPLLGMVDTAAVGHLPAPQHLAAVALGASAVGTLYFVFGFLRMGTTALTAQALGAEDGIELRTTLLRGLMVAVVVGLVLVLAEPLLIKGAVALFAPSAATRDELVAFLAIRLLAAPAALSSLVLLGWLIGLQDTRRPLVLMLATNLLNAVLDLGLVFGVGMAAAGVALATTTAEYAGLALGLLLIRRRWRELGGLPGLDAVMLPARFARLFRVNRDIMLRSLLLEIVFLTVTAVGSHLGETVLAANAVLTTMFMIAAYGLDGFAHATETLVGRAVGARSATALRDAMRAGFLSAALLAALMTLAFTLFGRSLVDLLTDLAPVRDAAGIYLPYAVLVPVVAVWAFLYDGVFFGATRTAELRNGMVLATLIFAALLGLLLPPLGNHGLWLAFLGFLGARGIILALLYRRTPAALAFAHP